MRSYSKIFSVGMLAAISAAAIGCGSSAPTYSQSSATKSEPSSAAHASTPVKAATVSTVSGKVLVDSQGHTLYVLTPESTAHLLCTSKECLTFWPPVTVSSAAALAHAAPAASGRVGDLRRSDGTLQLTIDGHPIYAYAGDTAAGTAQGENLRSFGGTWEAVNPRGTGAAPAGGASRSPY